MLRFRTRYLRFLTSVLAAAILVAPSADAQRKKPKKKPAATAKPKSAPKAAAPAPAAKEPVAAEPAAPEPEPEPEPMPKKKPSKAEKAEDTEAPAPEGNPEEDRGVVEKAKPTKMAPLIDAEIGLKGFQRHLAYQNDVNNVLPDYDLSGAPAIAINVGIYPIRTSSGSITAGVTGSFENAFSIGTTYREPQPNMGQEGTHTTSANAYAVGLRGNFNFGSNTLGIGAEYGAQNYTLDLPPPPMDGSNAQVPNVAYRFIRPSINGRIGLSNSVSILASFGYLYMLSAGQIVSADYFRGPITTASGIDVNLGVAWAPIASMKALEIRPMFGWRRVSFTFNTDPMNPDDRYIASGAHDDYLSLALMFGLRL